MTMSTENPLSGHTDGTNDGLTDGSHILSPSLTNLYEGVHGNGILLPHDTAYDDNDRNDPPDLPGAITAGSNAYSFVVKACDVILDGVLYAIGGGSDITVTLTSTTAQKIGSFTALTTGQECLFVVLATADGLKVTQSDRITTAVGAYPSISGDAASYLKSGSGSGDNRQTVVLGTVRATFNASAVSANDLNITISERNDKRVFVRPTPLYLSPVRDGTISATTGINGHTALSTVHTGQTGTFGDNGVIWQSFNSAGESMLYYSRKDSSNRHTHLLGPTNIDVSSPSTNQTFTFDGDSVFVLTPSTGITLNPSGTFPPGHTVFVSVPSGSTVTFDNTGLNQAIAAGDALMFAYDGTNWKRVLFSSTVATTSSGASGVVQLSDGAGGFTSDSTLSYDTAANELTVDGKLTVTGLIDPTGLELTPQATNPAAADAGVVDANTLWLDSDASNRLKQGASGVMRAGDAISELNNDAGFVDAAGAAAASPATNLTYTASTRVVASSTGTDATLTEVVAGGDSGLMTGAQATKLDGIAASATAYADADAISAVEGEATLNLAGDVTMASGKTLTVPDAIYVNRIQVGYGSGPGKLQAYNAGDNMEIHAAGDTGGNVKLITLDAGTDGAEANRITSITGHAAVSLTLDVTGDILAGGTVDGRDVAADGTKLDGIEASADVTDATNVKAALDGMTLTDIGTPASTDKVLIQDASDSDNIKYADFSEFGGGSSYTDAQAIAAVEGEATLDLTGQVTMAQDLKVSGVQYQQFMDLTGDLATGYHTIALIEGRSGGTGSGTGGSDQRGVGTFLIRNTDSSRHQTIMLTASHLFGAGNANGISVEHASYFSTIGISGFRIKENSTYDGAVLQINIADATNDIEVYLKNNFQESGWQLIQAVADATDPSTASLGVGYNAAYSDFTASATTSITDIAGLGQQIFGPLVLKSDLNVEDDLTVDTDTLVVDSTNNRVGVGTTSPAQALHVSGTIRQTAVTGNVLVANANGDLVAASNLSDQTYLQPGQAETDTFNPQVSAPNWSPPPVTIQEAIDRLAAYVVTIPGAPPTIP